MIDIDEWEKRSPNTPIKIHILAGSMAGLIEHLSMLPLDNIKTHLQVLPNTNITQTIKTLKSHGLKSYFSGYGAVSIGCMPAHALYFSSYEALKDLFKVTDENLYPTEFALIGAISTFFHDSLMVPFDVIKQRQQITELPFKKTLKYLLRQEGASSLYRSFAITYLMSAPYQAIFVSANETIKTLTSKAEDHTFFTHFLCAGLAGSIAATLVNPLDVVKTKLQTQTCHLNKSEIKYSSLLETFHLVRIEEGIKGFYKGLLPRLGMQTLSGATAWATYELIKRSLLNRVY